MRGAPVQPSWARALPPSAPGSWYVCGAPALDADFRGRDWQLLAHGLGDRRAAEEWVRRNCRRFEDLAHFAVDVNEPAGGEIAWETFDRGRDGEVYSARTGRKL